MPTLLRGWGRLRLGLRLGLLVFIAAAPEDLLKDVLLFLRWGWLRVVRSVAVRWRVGRVADNGSGSCGWRRRGFGSGGFVASDAEELLNEVLRVLPHLAAGIDWRCAIEEGHVEAIVRT